MAIALPAEAVLTVLKNGNRQRALSLKLPPQHLGDLLPELPGDRRHHHLGREPGAVQHTGGMPAPILVHASGSLDPIGAGQAVSGLPV
jgi:hypothetical protein